MQTGREHDGRGWGMEGEQPGWATSTKESITMSQSSNKF